MRIDTRHNLPATVSTVWQELFSEDYLEALYGQSNTTTQRLRDEVRNGRRFIQSRITLGRKLPATASKLLKAQHLSYIFEEHLDESTHTVRWRVIVDRVSDKVTASGTYQLIATGDTCDRIVRGEIRVNVPFIGRKIEQGICTELTKSYETAARFAREWLRNKQQ